jgi:hypothetical protein
MSGDQDLVNELNRFDPRLLPRLALQAMQLFEQWRDRPNGNHGPGDIESQVHSVRQAMIQLIERSGCCPTEIITALSKLRDPGLISLFRRCLSWQIANQDAGGVYATMIALDELGEKTFADRRSKSVQDWTLNRDLAAAYLNQSQETDR